MLKRLHTFIAICLLTGTGLAQAEIIDFRQPVYSRTPIEDFSTPGATLTTESDIEAISVENTPDDYIDFDRNGLYLDGETGSFTLTFDQPVESVGIDLFFFNNARMRSSMTPTILTAQYFGESSLYAKSTIEVTQTPSSLVNYFAEGITKVVYSWDAGVVTYRDFSDNITYEPGVIGVYAIQYPYTQPIPEPETYALMLAGLGLIGLMRRHRNSKA